MKSYEMGDKVTLSHPTYGTIRGTVHILGKSQPYVPLGFTHINLGKRLSNAGWKITDGWSDSPSDRVLAVIDGWDVGTSEATQGALADAIRSALGSR